MRWLVTGGLGFIGSNFIRLALRERSDLEIVNLDAMMTPVGLAHDEGRDHRRTRERDQPREAARGRGRLAEKRHPDSLAALRILIEWNADQLAAAQRLQHGARG